jgi:3-oxoacyl-[acyl-carrier protein] reductase
MDGRLQLDFEGKRVIVAGGSRGIGRSIALGFAAAGAAVSICARGAETLAKTKAELGQSAHAATCDLSDGAQVLRYISEAAEALGGRNPMPSLGFGMTDDGAWLGSKHHGRPSGDSARIASRCHI